MDRALVGAGPDDYAAFLRELPRRPFDRVFVDAEAAHDLDLEGFAAAGGDELGDLLGAVAGLAETVERGLDESKVIISVGSVHTPSVSLACHTWVFPLTIVPYANP